MKYALIQDYARRVLEQSQFVVMAHADMRAAVAKDQDARARRKHLDIFGEEWAALHRVMDDADRELRYAMQAFVIAVANVDKALWVNRGGSEARTEPVRTALGVTDNAATKTAREIRDLWEHYDDSLNRFRKHTDTLKVEGVGAPLKIEGHDDKHTVWRYYDPTTDTLSFFDKSVAVVPIVREARRLIPRAEEVLNRCARCMDEGREHAVTRDPGFPAGYDLPVLPDEGGSS